MSRFREKLLTDIMTYWPTDMIIRKKQENCSR